jgi:type VI secretion system protein ImpK
VSLRHRSPDVAAQLRGSATHPDPAGLREGLVRQVREFEQCARAKGLVDPVVLPARYVLCALVDESVLDTPWGTRASGPSRDS